MKILVAGAGMMGQAIIHDILQQSDLEKVGIIERDENRINHFKTLFNNPKLTFYQGDITQTDFVSKTMKEFDTFLSAVYYRFHFDLTNLAIENGLNFCDLGGNNTVVKNQLKLHEKAKERGVTVIPDCGVAPGLASLLVAAGSSEFETLNRANVRVGGLPQVPTPPLDYKLVFSVNGLINEYKEKTIAIRDGKIVERDSLDDLEEIEFPAPFGKLEAFNTSGGISTLPENFVGRINELDYKTIRYPGHCKRVKELFQMGFFDENEITFNGIKTTPRQMTETVLEQSLDIPGKDCILLRVQVEGKKDGSNYEKSYEIIDYEDEKTGLTAMMRMTGFPISIISQMMSRGQVPQKGVLPQELSLPHKIFLQELRKRDITIKENMKKM